MWKDTLSRKGIAAEALPAKIKRLINDYNEIESGVVELKSELQKATTDEEKRELNTDLNELEPALDALSNQIKKAIELMKTNPDGTVGQYTPQELNAAWEARRKAWIDNGKKEKTQSIF